MGSRIVFWGLPLDRRGKSTCYIEFEDRNNDGFEGKYICTWNHRKFIHSPVSECLLCVSVF